MSFVPLRDPALRVVMRSGLENFLSKMATALSVTLGEAREMARVLLNENSNDNNTTDIGGRSS